MLRTTRRFSQVKVVSGAIVFLALAVTLMGSVLLLFPLQIIAQSPDGSLQTDVAEGSRWSLAQQVGPHEQSRPENIDIPEAFLNGKPLVFERDHSYAVSTESERWESFATATISQSGSLVVNTDHIPSSVVLMKNDGMTRLLLIAPGAILMILSVLLLHLLL